MDDETRRHWEQIADRCFDRAHATALSAATLLMDTTASAHCGSKQGHQNGSDTDLEGSKK